MLFHTSPFRFSLRAAACLAVAASLVPTHAADEKAARAASSKADEGSSFFQDLLPLAWQKRPKLRFNVYTEMTPEGRKRPAPSPGKPLRYHAPPGNYTAAGWQTISGEKPPPWAELQETMQRALAAAGYVSIAAEGERPDVLIVFSYGSHSTDLAQLAVYPPPGTSEQPAFEPIIPPPVTAAELVPHLLTSPFFDAQAIKDVIDRARFIGGERVARELTTALSAETSNARLNASASRGGFEPLLPVSPAPGSPFDVLLNGANGEAMRHVLELAFHPCYFVTATAYDFAGVEKKQKIPLWQTRMTVEAQGVELREVLKPLIVSTAPFLGRETPEAVTIDKRLDREGRVQIGEATVVPDTPTPSRDEPKK